MKQKHAKLYSDMQEKQERLKVHSLQGKITAKRHLLCQDQFSLKFSTYEKSFLFSKVQLRLS